MPTGRGFVLGHTGFVKLFRMFCNSHFNYGFTLTLNLLVYWQFIVDRSQVHAPKKESEKRPPFCVCVKRSDKRKRSLPTICQDGLGANDDHDESLKLKKRARPCRRENEQYFAVSWATWLFALDLLYAPFLFNCLVRKLSFFFYQQKRAILYQLKS